MCRNIGRSEGIRLLGKLAGKKAGAKIYLKYKAAGNTYLANRTRDSSSDFPGAARQRSRGIW